MKIAFKLDMIPSTLTAQGAGKRLGIRGKHAVFFKTAEFDALEAEYVMRCKPHRPNPPLAGPVALWIDFVFPWRAGESRAVRALGRVPKTTKPDGGNMSKALEDCLTKAGFWIDDAQVADLRVTKAWGDAVGVYVSIETIEQPELQLSLL